MTLLEARHAAKLPISIILLRAIYRRYQIVQSWRSLFKKSSNAIYSVNAQTLLIVT